MRDETYVFVSEVREKKNIARSARNARTHTGKSGRVRFPSDYKTKKEILAMSGEVKSYRLNEPMSWAEFKAMPDDIKVVYIKLLRSKFDCTDSAIAEMLGIDKGFLSVTLTKLGIKNHKAGGRRKWDKGAWLAWVNGVSVLPEDAAEEIPVEEESPVAEEVEQTTEEMPCEECAACETPELMIPCSGDMSFVGSAANALKTVGMLLGDANVRICITWEVAN